MFDFLHSSKVNKVRVPHQPANGQGSQSRRPTRSVALLRCMNPLLAQSGHHDRADPFPLLGVKRTSRERSAMSTFDPSRKSGGQVCCAATKSLLVSWCHPLRCLVLSRGRRNEAALKSGRQSSDPPQASTALKEKRSDYHSGRGCSMNSESCALPASVCQDNEGVAERYE